MGSRGPKPTPPEDRFWAKVRKVQEPGGCWEWTSGRLHGYGVFYPNHGRLVHAHKWAYEFMVGSIPQGLEPDHLCRNRGCVKVIADEFGPAHIEMVTHQVNMLRGDSPTAQTVREGKCRRGHLLDEANTYVRPDGKRNCMECRRAGLRRWIAAQKSKTCGG